MNRNFRSLSIVLGLLLVAVVFIPTVGSSMRFVNAADQPEATAELPAADPTDLPASEQPTDAPTAEPTDVPATEPPFDEATAEPTTAPATEQSTDEPAAESTTEPAAEVTAEATETVTPGATLEPEVTPEATETPVVLPEETIEPEITLEPEMTPEATEVLLMPIFDVALACTESGINYVITNIGADMETASSFQLNVDSEANAAAPALPENLVVSEFPIEFMLLGGQTTTIAAAYGQPVLVLEGIPYQLETPCLPPAPPVIEASAVCTFETGVTFTITNSGSAMPAEQGYTITTITGETLSNTFQLGTGETTTIDAGYGQPTLTIGDLITVLDTACDAPTVITGTIWNDADSDAVRGAAEVGIAGVTVSLLNASAGDVKSAITTTDGSYRFENLPVGNYTVVVDTNTLSADYVLSYPASTSVALDAFAAVNSADFGFTATPTAAVTGTVWLETENYGIRDTSEMGINGVIVELVDTTGLVVAVTPVDALTGTYVFTAILSGDYTIRLNQATLFTPNGVTWNSDDTFDYETHITLTPNQTLINVDFGLVGTY